MDKVPWPDILTPHLNLCAAGSADELAVKREKLHGRWISSVTNSKAIISGTKKAHPRSAGIIST